MKTFTADKLAVEVHPTREEMGRAAGRAVETTIQEMLRSQDEVRIIFAAAPSQNELLAYLRHSNMIPWERITAFHMDEYLGLPREAEQRFANFLKERLFDQVPFGAVHLIDGGEDRATECRRYSALLSEKPIDIVCLGIGENGHIAFNDPPVADFDDPEVTKVVELDQACRQQQVNDGCFVALEKVPQEALTLTIPALMQGRFLYCVVPGATKREAVARTLEAPITTDCPATILRTHPNARLYLDQDSYQEAD